MSSLCAATLGVKENPDFIHSFREYLQCHLSGETYFTALKPHYHNAAPNNEWPRHVASSRKFTYEFHFGFVALRSRGVHTPSPRVPDPRGLRHWYRLIGALNPDSDTYEDEAFDLACYDATTSFLIIGTDECN